MKETTYRILRSSRRTIGLQINQKAELVVRAPFFASERLIEEVVREKTDWILRTQERIRTASAQTVPRRYEEGETFWYQGERYPLRWVEGPARRIEFRDGSFYLAREFSKWAPEMFEEWYRSEAACWMPPLVEKYAARLGVAYRSIKINGAKGRWGSASADGRLNFSFRLMMTPPEVIDYVAAHEVAHLRERNHSSRFWKTVASLCPAYRTHERWLRRESRQLIWD